MQYSSSFLKNEALKLVRELTKCSNSIIIFYRKSKCLPCNSSFSTSITVPRYHFIYTEWKEIVICLHHIAERLLDAFINIVAWEDHLHNFERHTPLIDLWIYIKVHLYRANAKAKISLILTATQCEQPIEFPKNLSGSDVAMAFAYFQYKRAFMVINERFPI